MSGDSSSPQIATDGPAGGPCSVKTRGAQQPARQRQVIQMKRMATLCRSVATAKHCLMIPPSLTTLFLSWHPAVSRHEARGEDSVQAGSNLVAAHAMLVDPGDGSPPRVELVAHPGEVWLRYTHDKTEPWTKVDLRRNSRGKNQGQYSRNEEGIWSCIRSKVSHNLPLHGTLTDAFCRTCPTSSSS